MAAAVAVECFNVMEEEGVYQKVREESAYLASLMHDVREKTKRLMNVRHIGAIVAADLMIDDKDPTLRWGYQVYREAVRRGVLLRPIGNTIYWLPPLTIDRADLIVLREVTIDAIHSVLSS